MRCLTFMCSLLLGLAVVCLPNKLVAQEQLIDKKVLELTAKTAKDSVHVFHLLPAEDEQEPGNAVPVLLRMVYEQSEFMSSVYPKLQEYAVMDINDPKLNELGFNSFARQAIRAGSMSYAEWQYPLRGDHPSLILLPDIQSQRQLIGRGMTAWIKQRLAKGDMDAALTGIRAQLGCARHCAATPVVVCHFVGLAIANNAFDSLELAMQYEDCPNMYWSLAAMSPTLQDLGPMVRWELWATPARLNEPLPPVGDEAWINIAHKFVEQFAEFSDESYSEKEGAELQKTIDRLARKVLSTELGFSDADIQFMTSEERVMRYIYLHYCKIRNQLEPLSYQSPQQVIAAGQKLEADTKALLTATGAKSSPFPAILPTGILTCRSFERRVKMLQTIEAIRDYSSKHEGRLPANLAELDLLAPNDPFTGKPFEYSLEGTTARLAQAKLDGCKTMIYDYQLKMK